MPRAIAGCTSLEVLLLSGNRLRGLTSGVGHCQALQVVDLESNAYRHLPAPLGTLTQLKVCLYLCVGEGVSTMWCPCCAAAAGAAASVGAAALAPPAVPKHTPLTHTHIDTHPR